MTDSPLETRIRLQTSFQDSYLEDHSRRVEDPSRRIELEDPSRRVQDHSRRTDLLSVDLLAHQIQQAEMELQLNKATNQFLLKTFSNKKIKTPKEGVVSTASEYLDKALTYQASLARLNNFKQNQ